jgi:acyl-CoA thioester hydrolase
MITVHQGVAHPWNCDVLGHMTTRFYIAMFDDACYHLLHHVFGWKGNQDDEGKLAWVDVRHVNEFLTEVVAGDLLEVRAGLVKIGTKSITILYEMTNLASGEISARQECTCVLFDKKHRASAVIPDDLRKKADEFLIRSQGDK